MGVAATCEKLLGQRNERDSLAHRLPRMRVQRTGSGGHDSGTSERLLQANACRTAKYELMSRLTFASKCIVGGILTERPAEIGFRTKIAGSGKTIQREI